MLLAFGIYVSIAHYSQSYIEKRLSAIEAIVLVTEIFLFYIFLLLHLCTSYEAL